MAWKDQLTECVIQIRTIITAIKNSLGIHRGDDLADLDVIIIRRNRQARYEARLQDHAERPATRFLRLQIGITSGKNLKCLRPRDWIGASRRNDLHRAIGWPINCSRVEQTEDDMKMGRDTVRGRGCQIGKI